MADELPARFTSPIHQALTEPNLWAGVPRTFGILNCCLTLAAVIGFHWWWYLVIGMSIHWVVRQLSKHDPSFIGTLLRSLRYRTYYRS